MSGSTKIQISSLSVQYSPLLDEKSFQDNFNRRRKNEQKFSILKDGVELNIKSTDQNLRSAGDQTLRLSDQNNVDQYLENLNVVNVKKSDFSNSDEDLSNCSSPIVHNVTKPKIKNSDNWTKDQNKFVPKEKSELVKSVIASNIPNIRSRIKSGDNVNEEDHYGRKPLHYGCISGNLEVIKVLLEEGCDILAANSERITSLHIAVKFKRNAILTFLLDNGAIPDVREKKNCRTPVHDAILFAKSEEDFIILKILILKLREDPWEARRILKIGDKNGQTALHYAASNSRAETVALLLSAGADVAASDNFGQTPMHISIMSPHNGENECGDVLTLLLEAGGDVEVQGYNEERLTHLAAKVGCCVCLEFLRMWGGDLEAKDRLGRTPLHLAALHGKYETVRFLILNGVHFDDPDFKGLTPLHLAILGDDSATLTLLIRAGSSLTRRDSIGRTYVQYAIAHKKNNAFGTLVKLDAVDLPPESAEDVIHFCASIGLSEYVKILIESDWDINLRDKDGATVLHRALNHGHEDLATMLINNNAAIHAVDCKGASPLHYAVRWGGSDAILRLLLKKKCKLNARDKLGRTPLHYAASKLSVMSDLYILLDGGSPLNAQDEMGLTPLHLAARLGNESLVRILLERGAVPDKKDAHAFKPIDHAVEKGHKSIVKRILDHEEKLKQACACGEK